MSDEKEPLINANPTLQNYYGSLESRIGYRLFLGDTRHFGYYEPDAWWPFPIGRALRRMEDSLYKSLQLPPGSKVIDAGCGVGHVAIRMASHGLNVFAFDVVKHHVKKAQRNVRKAGYEKDITVHCMDYHHLEDLRDNDFDGVYTMETLVHATDPAKVLEGFYRILKPGGHIACHEYDHPEDYASRKDVPQNLFTDLRRINREASMAANEIFTEPAVRSMLEKQGFTDIKCEEISEHIKPLVWLFYIVAYIPFIFISFLGLQSSFVNTWAGIEGAKVLKYRLWRYVVWTARKPTYVSPQNGGLRVRNVG